LLIVAFLVYMFLLQVLKTTNRETEGTGLLFAGLTLDELKFRL